jgi:tetratricopeptide (TPR) repeat protein
VLAPNQILERLVQRLDLLRGGRDAETRQRTLRATIDWSHELLTHEEKQLFARLSVFRGGCTLESAETVAGAEIDTLESLVDKSLLRRTGERFWLLETIQEYAAERLQDSSAAERLRRRHADHLVNVSEDARGQMYTTAQSQVVQRLSDELDNVRAAISWSLVAAPDTALRLASALEDFWLIRGHLAEGRQCLEEALARARPNSTSLRVRALAAATWVALRQGDVDALTTFAEEGLEAAQRRGETESILSCSTALGMAAGWRGDLKRSEAIYREAASLARSEGATTWVATSIANLGLLALERESFAEALVLFEEALVLCAELGDDWNRAAGLVNMGLATFYLGRHDDAATKFREALDVSARLQNIETVAYALIGLAAVDERPRPAARLLGAAERLLEEAGAGAQQEERKLQEKTVAVLAGRLPDDEFASAWDSGRSMSLGEAVAYVLSLD